MRGKAILFPLFHGFCYWFPEDHYVNEGNLKILGKIVTLTHKTTCRMCGKAMKAGEQARSDTLYSDYIKYPVNGFIHPEKCIPRIEAVLGHIVDGSFEEKFRLSNDDVTFTEGFNPHSVEGAKEEMEYLLDSYFNGVYDLCYIEADNVRDPEPVYSKRFQESREVCNVPQN